jgi:hypothetical protein
MAFKCPSCGRQNYGTFKNCVCGHYVDESVIIAYSLMDSQGASIEGEQFLDMPPNGTTDHMSSSERAIKNHHVKVLERSDSINNMPLEEVIKEIDSWKFTFSSADNCVCIGTPALQSFRLKLAPQDLEDLLEFLYQKTGNEKTTRKCRLSTEEIAEVIDKVNRMIEEKRSKLALKLNSNELQAIADLINVKLKV